MYREPAYTLNHRAIEERECARYREGEKAISIPGGGKVHMVGVQVELEVPRHHLVSVQPLRNVLVRILDLRDVRFLFSGPNELALR